MSRDSTFQLLKVLIGQTSKIVQIVKVNVKTSEMTDRRVENTRLVS